MAQQKRRISYDKERAAALRESGVRTLVVTVPDLARAIPGGIGDGAYISVSVHLPACQETAGGKPTPIYESFYEIGPKGRFERVADFDLFEENRRRKKKTVGLSDTLFLSLIQHPAHRSTRRLHADMELLSALVATPPPPDGGPISKATLAAAQPAPAAQPAAAAASAPAAQPAASAQPAAAAAQ